MFEYICRTSQCSLKDVTRKEYKNTSRFIEGKFINSASICPKCKQVGEEVKQEFKGFPTAFHGQNIGKG